MEKFIIKKQINGQFYFVLAATNGQTILKSEAYDSKQGCINGMNSVKNNAPEDARYERLVSKNGQFYFNLKARNGEIIGTSEMYTTEPGRNNGIEAVKKSAPTADIEDATK